MMGYDQSENKTPHKNKKKKTQTNSITITG